MYCSSGHSEGRVGGGIYKKLLSRGTSGNKGEGGQTVARL
jgi:hypothetical protein